MNVEEFVCEVAEEVVETSVLNISEAGDITVINHKDQSGSELSAVLRRCSFSESRQESESPGPVDRLTPCDFEPKNLIGCGAYGKVYRVRKKTGEDADRYFALKIIKKKDVCNNSKNFAHTKAERTILANIRHPFIVGLFYAFQNAGQLFMALEYIPGGELFTVLADKTRLSSESARFYASEVTLALGYLHSKDIIYRDLKPENIMINSDGHIKLADFNLAKINIDDSSRTYTFCGTLSYMAPEIVEHKGHGKPVDWYALGVLVYDMLNGAAIFDHRRKSVVKLRIMRCRYKIPDEFDYNSKIFIRALVHKKVATRLGTVNDVEAVKNHIYFKSINWDDVINKRLKPPYIPNIQSIDDVGNFGKEFTEQDPKLDLDKDSDYDDSVFTFKDFTYNAPSTLEEIYRKKESMVDDDDGNDSTDLYSNGARSSSNYSSESSCERPRYCSKASSYTQPHCSDFEMMQLE